LINVNSSILVVKNNQLSSEPVGTENLRRSRSQPVSRQLQWRRRKSGRRWNIAERSRKLRAYRQTIYSHSTQRLDT